MVCLLMFNTVAVCFAEGEHYTDISVGKVYSNEDVVNIPIILESNTGFSSLEVEIEYDKSVIELIGCEQFPNSVSAEHAPSYDVLPYNLLWISANDCKFNGNVAVLTFKLKREIGKNDILVIPLKISCYSGINGNYVDGVDCNFRLNMESINLRYHDGYIVFCGSAVGEDITIFDVSYSGERKFKSIDQVSIEDILSKTFENLIAVDSKTYIPYNLVYNNE